MRSGATTAQWDSYGLKRIDDELSVEVREQYKESVRLGLRLEVPARAQQPENNAKNMNTERRSVVCMWGIFVTQNIFEDKLSLCDDVCPLC